MTLVCHDHATVFWIGHADSTRRRCRSTEVLLAYSRSVRQRMRDGVVLGQSATEIKVWHDKIYIWVQTQSILGSATLKQTRTNWSLWAKQRSGSGLKSNRSRHHKPRPNERKKILTDQNKDPKKHCPSSVLHVIELTAQIIH